MVHLARQEGSTPAQQQSHCMSTAQPVWGLQDYGSLFQEAQALVGFGAAFEHVPGEGQLAVEGDSQEFQVALLTDDGRIVKGGSGKGPGLAMVGDGHGLGFGGLKLHVPLGTPPGRQLPAA